MSGESIITRIIADLPRGMPPTAIVHHCAQQPWGYRNPWLTILRVSAVMMSGIRLTGEQGIRQPLTRALTEWAIRLSC